MAAGGIGLALALIAMLLPGRVILQAKSVQSVPFHVGLWLPPPVTWQAGQLVAFRTPDLRPYYPAGTPFTKIVTAVPGDRLARLGRDFYVNGRYVATARATDSQGRVARLFAARSRPLSVCRETAAWTESCREVLGVVVPEGRLFVLGTHERSFDSRYWGYVERETILGRVVKVL